jgi:hypothetical protein
MGASVGGRKSACRRCRAIGVGRRLAMGGTQSRPSCQSDPSSSTSPSTFDRLDAAAVAEAGCGYQHRRRGDVRDIDRVTPLGATKAVYGGEPPAAQALILAALRRLGVDVLHHPVTFLQRWQCLAGPRLDVRIHARVVSENCAGGSVDSTCGSVASADRRDRRLSPMRRGSRKKKPNPTRKSIK